MDINFTSTEHLPNINVNNPLNKSGFKYPELYSDDMITTINNFYFNAYYYWTGNRGA